MNLTRISCDEKSETGVGSSGGAAKTNAGNEEINKTAIINANIAFLISVYTSICDGDDGKSIPRQSKVYIWVNVDTITRWYCFSTILGRKWY